MTYKSRKKPSNSTQKPEETIFSFGANIIPLKEGAMESPGLLAQLDDELSQKKLAEPVSLNQQENVLQHFEMSSENFKQIEEQMSALSANATKKQKLDKLFEIIKIGGELGIRYEPSTKRGKSKMPNEVLIPNKEGNLTGDCNELVLLFVASAKQLEIDISDMAVALMRLETSPAGKDPMHAAVISRAV